MARGETERTIENRVMGVGKARGVGRSHPYPHPVPSPPFSMGEPLVGRDELFVNVVVVVVVVVPLQFVFFADRVLVAMSFKNRVNSIFT